MTALDLKEFQALFAQEAEIRLAALGQLMLQLERDGSDEELIGAIFREVHTLKGSAAVVGFDLVSRVAHTLEERLEDIRSGRRAVTPETVDALLSAVDRRAGRGRGLRRPFPRRSTAGAGRRRAGRGQRHRR
jgi:two-component system chemotaxis sensor kinase CheA